jgi:hypothetical protein
MPLTLRHVGWSRRAICRRLGLALVCGLLAFAARADDGGGCPSQEAEDLEPGEPVSDLSGQAVP